MKALGNRNDIMRLLRARLGPGTPLPLLSAIDGDFAFIAAFWSQALHKMAQRLFELRGFLADNPGIGPHDPRFQNLRKELARHLGDLANDTKERFGDPLGLVAMHYAAGRAASATAKLDCPLFSLSLPKAAPARVES
jgi:hypothetical protein